MEIPGYKIEEEIGKGGMARVYLALHESLNRKVAIKVMNRPQGGDTAFSDRFLREARIVANLTHPNIVTIHDVGETNGYSYLVMELLPSRETLKDKIKKGVNSQFALSILRQVATALKAAHEKDIVHRDIKPDNIMFRQDGSAVLMDFGVARSVDSATTQMTQAGLVVGTPQYISPEQVDGKNIGPHSDIYSLGVVFYEMLMGKVPYTADTPLALCYQHAFEPVPVLTGDFAVYQPLLDRMMAKNRIERYSDCDEIIADIDKIEAGKPVANAASFNTVAIDMSHANVTGESPGFSGDESTNKSARKETVLTIAQEKKARDKKGIKVTGSEKSEKKSKSLLWVVALLLIAGGAYSLVDADIKKLMTLIGLDPGPVYSSVGRLISIPGGSFKMGNSSGDSTERPVHTVNIDGFRLAETEVTQKQWREVMGSNASHFKGCDDCPVENVSWNDIQVFLKKLNEQTGLRFRLPTEAEWEYACRSAGQNEKYCGGGDANKLAWYGSNSKEKTHPVAQKQPNDLGLHDMSGNVWEWTQDCWHDNYHGAPTNGRARTGGTCAQRILRGGSWIDVAGGMSSTGRLGSSPDKGNRISGFRVAQDLQ